MKICRRLTVARPPAEVLAALALDPREWVLAWSPLVGGGAVVATVRGLRGLTPQRRSVHADWSQVRQVSWDPGSATLAVTWVSSRRTTALELTAPRRLPVVVHERVRSSLVLSREVGATGEPSVWVALRRTGDGRVVVQVVPSPGVRLADPVIANAVRRAERDLRDEVGGLAQESPGDADPERHGEGRVTSDPGFGTVHVADPA